MERIILPDSCTLLDYMLVKLRGLVAGLIVYPEHMQRNLELTKGLYHSQTILLELTRRGLERKTAYEAVQRAAMKTWRGTIRRWPKISAPNRPIAEVLPGEEIDRLCSLAPHLRHVDDTFRRLLVCVCFFRAAGLDTPAGETIVWLAFPVDPGRIDMCPNGSQRFRVALIFHDEKFASLRRTPADFRWVPSA